MKYISYSAVVIILALVGVYYLDVNNTPINVATASKVAPIPQQVQPQEHFISYDFDKKEIKDQEKKTKPTYRFDGGGNGKKIIDVDQQRIIYNKIEDLQQKKAAMQKQLFKYETRVIQLDKKKNEANIKAAQLYIQKCNKEIQQLERQL